MSWSFPAAAGDVLLPPNQPRAPTNRGRARHLDDRPDREGGRFPARHCRLCRWYARPPAGARRPREQPSGIMRQGPGRRSRRRCRRHMTRKGHDDIGLWRRRGDGDAFGDVVHRPAAGARPRARPDGPPLCRSSPGASSGRIRTGAQFPRWTASGFALAVGGPPPQRSHMPGTAARPPPPQACPPWPGRSCPGRPSDGPAPVSSPKRGNVSFGELEELCRRRREHVFEIPRAGRWCRYHARPARTGTNDARAPHGRPRPAARRGRQLGRASAPSPCRKRREASGWRPPSSGPVCRSASPGGPGSWQCRSGGDGPGFPARRCRSRLRNLSRCRPGSATRVRMRSRYPSGGAHQLHLVGVEAEVVEPPHPFGDLVALLLGTDHHVFGKSVPRA